MAWCRAESDPAATVSGGEGTDNLRFHVFDYSGRDRPVYAELDGGEDFLPFETDVGSRTSNVAHAGGVEDLDTI